MNMSNLYKHYIHAAKDWKNGSFSIVQWKIECTKNITCYFI